MPSGDKRKEKKKADKKKNKKQYEIQAEDEEEDELNDDDEEEYDQEESDDNKFIADDDEVAAEIEDQKRREIRKFKKEQRKQRKLNKMVENDDSIDEEDLDLIKENKQSRLRKLQKMNDDEDVAQNDQSTDSINQHKRGQKYDQIDSRIKNEDLEKRGKMGHQMDIKKQMFEKRGGDSTAADEDQTAAHLQQNQSLKDKFVTEDIDDLFGTPNDIDIAEKDIPERLQIRLTGRLNPSDIELEQETDWIFNNIIDSLAASGVGGQMIYQKIQDIKAKILKTLKFFRCENLDIPFVTKYKMNELIPELEPTDIWRIFNLDIEYGKFQIQKKQCEEFFSKISEFGNPMHMEHYKNQIFHTKNQRDLNDFQPLINFYKSYYQKELEVVVMNKTKKLPVPKREFVFNARQKKLDEFSRRCLLSPIEIVENINEDRQIHKPQQPSILPVDMSKEYANQSLIQSTTENVKIRDICLDVIKEMCIFSAAELQSQPDIRRGFKKHYYDYGVITTQPTEKGKKELDVFHPSYRVKRVSKKLSDLQNTDLFLDILQNESLGLITYSIQIKDDCQDQKIGNKYFQNMYEKYKFPDDQGQWNLVRREIFQIFNAPNTASTADKQKGQKHFLTSIMDEIKEELREDAETYVINQCGDKYRGMINTGYFKKENENRILQNKSTGGSKKFEDDIIPQRERLNVLGAVMYPIDNRNYMTQIAVIDQYGELVNHMDFYHIIPPRKSKPKDQYGNQNIPRPGEAEEMAKHQEDKKRFQELLRNHSVDLIVVCADCLEAKRLKKHLGDFANLKNHSDPNGEDDEDMQNDNYNMDDLDGSEKEAIVIWGRPEIPKLFAQSHYSQKLLKNQPFILKKAICLARYEQDPMNEILNLWSPIMSENQSLHLNLHPLQKHINQARLIDILEEINIQTVNLIGIDINLLCVHEHWHNQLQFLSGLGPRKAQRYIQKLRQLGKPISTRYDIHSQKLLKRNCFESSLGFTKVRVPLDKRQDLENMQTNILDQTRIHVRHYNYVYKLVTDYMYEDQPDIEEYKKKQGVNDLLKNTEKLKEFAQGEYKEQLKKMNNVIITYIFDQIIEDLMHPFVDPREDKTIVRTASDQKFGNLELFYCLIDESERTFKRGIIVSATVVRVFESNPTHPGRILCRLENGLDANISDKDVDFGNTGAGTSLMQTVAIGSIITGRIEKIKFEEKIANDDNFSVILNCKKQDLMHHSKYIEDDGFEYPQEDLININFKVQDEQSQSQAKSMIQKRKIQHQRFQNIASKTAINLLMKEDNGEFYFRPSSKGNNNLTLTWKFYEDNIVHIDIKELDKAIGANIGSKLQISDEVYENLQEIVERYIIPCNRSLREVTQHPKFQQCKNIEELQKNLENEKNEDNSRIPYRFTVLDKYPQYVILAYIPKKDLVKEYIKVKPRGYFFHHEYRYPFQNMINWFKEKFRTKDYQRYLRKTGSPQQVLATGIPQQSQYGSGQAQNPSNMPMQNQTGMDINQSNQWGADANEDEPMKNEDGNKRGGYGRGSRYGDHAGRSPGARDSGQPWGQNDSVKDEREKSGAGWGEQKQGGSNWDAGANDNSGQQSPSRSERGGYRGRGRGDRGGFGRGDRGDFRGRGRGDFRGRGEGRGDFRGRGGDRPRTCFKCHEEGHTARDCTNADAQNDRGGFGGDRPPNKCYNCQGEGHFARDCPEPQKPRERREPRENNYGGDNQGGYKRQRRDDNNDGGGFKLNDTESTWKGANTGWGQNAGAGDQNQWGAGGNDDNQKAGGAEGGWGANSQNQNDKKEANDGFGGGNANTQESGGGGGWGNEAKNNSQENGGGWN